MTVSCANRTYCVYKHTSPSGKSYIGITCQNPNERWGKTGNGYRDQLKFHNAIQKYGWDKISHEILQDGLSLEDALRVEQDMIRKYDSFYHGYNATLGGEGCRGMNSVAVYCEETDAVYENQHIAADILGVSNRSISQCCNGNSSRAGHYHVSFVDPNRLESNRQKQRISPRRTSIGVPRPVTMYNLDGEKICDYPSIKAASQSTGDPSYLIGKCCNYKSQNCRNHRYTYQGETLKSLEGYVPCVIGGNIIYKKPRSARPVLQFDKSGAFIARYNSIKEASARTGIKSSGICESANKRNMMSYGYYWMYADSQYDLKPHKDRGPKRVLCIDTGEIFNTAREAADATGISYKAISRNCTGDHQSAGGLHFRFADII